MLGDADAAAAMRGGGEMERKEGEERGSFA